MKRGRLKGLNPQSLMRLAVDENPPEDEDEIPEVPGYEIRSVLGRGAAGTVYEARVKNGPGLVAIKLLTGEHISDGLQRERIAREAQVMGSLSHPNVVKIYEFIDLKSTVGIVMELVEGQTLRERLRTGVEVEIDEAIRITGEIADALGVVHESGLTHRDLKPENILINSEGKIKVTDFGIAFSEESGAPRLTLTGMTLGTIGYMSPEQVDGISVVDSRSDIYSLAVVLHELITGEFPNQILEPPSLYRPGLAAHINEAVVKALSLSPSDRFATVSEFIKALGGTGDGEANAKQSGLFKGFGRKKPSKN
ncbi:MAG: serine/threonine-protein kinase [Verrucomicrobiales bacterium]|nr:serine/threonine-protein kinase [Verrucomicrobiales bacterium]